MTSSLLPEIQYYIKKKRHYALASDGAGALQELVNSRNNREAVLITREKKQAEPPPAPWHDQYLHDLTSPSISPSPQFRRQRGERTETLLAQTQPLDPSLHLNWAGGPGSSQPRRCRRLSLPDWELRGSHRGSLHSQLPMLREKDTQTIWLLNSFNSIGYIHFTTLQQVKKKLFRNYMTLRNIIKTLQCNAVYW